VIARIDEARCWQHPGGICEVVADAFRRTGSHVSWDRKLDGRLAAGAHVHPASEGVEIGWVRDIARLGSEVHDEIVAARESRTGNVRRKDEPRRRNRGG
jgi:chorismate synthase